MKDHFSCADADRLGVVAQQGNTVSAPKGEVITAVCIDTYDKVYDNFYNIGSDHNKYESNGVRGCYTVSGLGTNSVTVEPGEGCQPIYHFDLYTEPIPVGVSQMAETGVSSATVLVTLAVVGLLLMLWGLVKQED